MGLFGTTVRGVQTGTVAGTFKTVVGLKLANTTGHKARLRKIRVSAGGTPTDLQVEVRVRRTDNSGDGTSTAWNVNQIGNLDKESVASRIAAIGYNYSAEPTTYATGIVAGGSLNMRGFFYDQWAPREGPEWGINQTLGIEATIGSGSTAADLVVEVEWEEE